MAQVPLVALVCAGCGVTLMRHPAMRNRRIICFPCQKKRKSEARGAQKASKSAAIDAGSIRNRPSGVAFVVKYTNGQKHHIVVEHDALREGDQVAMILARQKQREGVLPDGEIATVSRLRTV